MRGSRRSRRRQLATRIGPPLGLAAIAAALAGVVVRRRRSAYVPPPARESYHCECGQEFRVAGRDRHRIYWLADAPEGQPVLGSDCPRCERDLPQGTARDAPAVGAPA